MLATFAKLGVRCFGGPAAHLGYFRAEIVERRRWIDEEAYADLVGLCQFLPGPASSQAGFALGLIRGGYLGGLAAWAGFTLPSAILLVAFAFGAGNLADSMAGAGLLHGLKLVAVAIVAQAVWSMARSFCPDRQRATVAVIALTIALLAPPFLGQIGAIVLGGVAGLRFCLMPPDKAVGVPRQALAMPVSRRAGIGFLVLFAALLLLLPLLRGLGMGMAVFNAFYRSGALVFGGGHVILPLLRSAVVTPGWMPDTAFLAGYGAAQAVPGPLFAFAAYLGATIRAPWGGQGLWSGQGPWGELGGAIIALVAIFLPGILLLMGVLPFWSELRTRPQAQAALRGINAAVVGLLGAALYNPVWTSAILKPSDFAMAVAGFVLLVVWKAPPVLVVGLGALAGTGLGLIG